MMKTATATTDWRDFDGHLATAYRIEKRTIQGIEQHRHVWLMKDGTEDTDRWINMTPGTFWLPAYQGD